MQRPKDLDDLKYLRKARGVGRRIKGKESLISEKGLKSFLVRSDPSGSLSTGKDVE